MGSVWRRRGLLLHDLGTGDVLALPPGFESCLTFDARGRRLAGYSPGAGTNPFSPSYREPRPIRVWDPASGRCFELVDPLCVDTTALALDTDGRRIAVGGGTGDIVVWEVDAEAVVARLKADSREITALAFFPGGGPLIAASDRTIRVWDLAAQATTAALFQHTDRIKSMALDDAGERLVSGGWDGSLLVWDARCLGDARMPLNPDGASVCVARQSLRVLSGSTSGSVRRSAEQRAPVLTWVAAAGESAFELGLHGDTVQAVAITSDGRTGASGSYMSGEITVWDLESRDARLRLQPPLVSHGLVGGGGMDDYGSPASSAGPPRRAPARGRADPG